ncbi:hypothetical protein [Lysobacter sp. CFH 32150]|uniref:hypothetical protein n=1 Tax=Lysobacter sp. CFH 32150 TaxID=2927128 RepID=UPI001FA7EA02|nr:hypothetical protein [Lysobacter sp. CFH 32150]MCI4567873.1 hypothetical protein [Lysobacter sp. CFH 32150]
MSAHDNGLNGSDLDRELRLRHAQALANLSPRTLAQLQQRRKTALSPRASAPMRAFAWPLAAACAIGVLALGLQLRQPEVAPATTAVVASDTNDVDDAYAALDETPELYLWLASNDAVTLASE